MKYEVEDIGQHEGKRILYFTISSDTGYKWTLTNFGGIIHQWFCPDKHGNTEDVLLGCADIKDYMGNHPFFGALVGRYANRIALGRMTVEGTVYQLATNLGRHHLHGGKEGFDKKIWDVEIKQRDTEICIILNYLSPHLEENYPGNLSVQVQYTFSNDGSLMIEYEATTDRATHLNLTNHCYFNLAGQSSGTILDHLVRIRSKYITETDEELIPTGRLLPVENTPFDFTAPAAIGDRIFQEDIYLRLGSGFDHNFVLNPQDLNQPSATVLHPDSGRFMELYTDQPAMQFYTGNHLLGVPGKTGTYGNFAGFCLETQHYPDSPHHPEFPSTLLLPDSTFRSFTKYRISVL